MKSGHRIAQLLLRSMYQGRLRGPSHAFLFSEPGKRHAGLGSLGVEISYDRIALIECALAYRQEGPSFLRDLPLTEVQSLLKKFVQEYYGILSGETFLRRFETSYAEILTAQTISEFAEALNKSELYSPCNSVVLFPLSPVKVETPFDGKNLFLCASRDLSVGRIGLSMPANHLVGDQFPPFSDFGGRKQTVTSWLGIRSPDVRAARKWRAAVIGALALCVYYRQSFTGRNIVSGICQIKENEGANCSFDEKHTPAISHDVVITISDHKWLNKTDEMLGSSDKQLRRYVKALEYFYRSWPRQDVERFPLSFMTLDAVFGEKNHATQAVVDGVRNTIGDHIEETRMRELMEMRASVIHGGSPDIYDSRKYPKYIRKYSADPIRDLDDIVAESLRRRVFSGYLCIHENPQKEIIEKLIAEGRLFPNYDDGSILKIKESW